MAYDDREADGPTGWSPGAVVLVAVLVLVLGLGGAVVGVYFANQRPAPRPTSTFAADPGTAKPTPTPSASQPTPTATPSTADFELPDVTGLDFRQARDQLRAMKLGVTVTFTSGGEGDYKVDSTTPTAQTTVHKGVTVKLAVDGAAPLVTVPNLRDHPCSEVAGLLNDAGLYPAYPAGRKGVVVAQDPGSDATDVHWNDKVSVTCGEPSPSASPA
jgi:cytoskeletal protein RodZ